MILKNIFGLPPPNHDLTFEIDGITDEMYEVLQTRVLQLRNSELECININNSQILLDNSECGNIYVNGLFVTHIKDGYKFGYNLQPDCIKLDRDRRTVNDFDLSWQTSTLWTNVDNIDLINELVNSGYSDIKYLDSTLSCDSNTTIQDMRVNLFFKEYGENALPVLDQNEMEYVQSKYSNVKPVIVNNSKYELISNNIKYEDRNHSLEEHDEKHKSPLEILSEFDEMFGSELTTMALDRFNKILKLSEDWN